MALYVRRRRNTPLVVMLAMAVLFTMAAGIGHLRGEWRLADWFTRPGPAVALAASRPTSLEIPTLGVETEVSPVGLDSDGSIAAPPLDRAFVQGDAGFARPSGKIRDESGTRRRAGR